MTKHEPILKSHWERYQQHLTIDTSTFKKLLTPFTHDDIKTTALLSEGCANTNYKIEFATKDPVVLRIYLREKSALIRETALHQLVADKLPVPEILYCDDSCTLIPHPYAIIDFIDGESMRDVILSNNIESISECAFSAGVYLNQLRSISLPYGGFFQDSHLTIRPFNKDEEYLAFATSCTKHQNVSESLGNQRVKAVLDLINKNLHFLPTKTDANLTHADFDPANMLVKKVDDRYEIVAILDWEFAFSGSYLLDMGMFLRYSHKLSSTYEMNFINGITASGKTLPGHWKKSAKLMDMICLLSLLYWNPKHERPNLNADVVSLIQNTLDNWDQY